MMKKSWVVVFFLVLFVILAGCSKKASQPDSSFKNVKNEEEAYTFLDALGRKVEVRTSKKGSIRAVACIGSFAQVWNLAGGNVAGATSDTFKEDRNNEHNFGTDVGSIQSPNTEMIISLKPDIVFLSSNIEGQRKLMNVLESAGIRTAYFSVETFEDYLGMLKTCTQITGNTVNYKKYGVDVKTDIDAVLNSVQRKKSYRVLLLRAYSTGINVKNSKNNMVGKMLSDLGCVNVADNDKTILENLSMEAIIKVDPDFIFVVPMGEEKEAEQIVEKELKANPAWKGLNAVQNNRVITLPKEYFQYKPNEKWSESYEMLAKILYQ